MLSTVAYSLGRSEYSLARALRKKSDSLTRARVRYESEEIEESAGPTSLCSRSKAQKYPHHAQATNALPAWFLCEQNLIWMRRLIAEALHVETPKPFALKQRQHSM
jgi:hypothetical protein